jgi:hypothetical protein
MNAVAQSPAPAAPARTFTMKAVSSNSFAVVHTQTTWKFLIVQGALDGRHGCSLTPYTIHIVSPLDGSTSFVAATNVYTSWSSAVQASAIQTMINNALTYAAAVDRATIWVDQEIVGQSEARVELGKLASKGLTTAAKRKRVAAFTAALVELGHGRIAVGSGGYSFSVLVGGHAAWVSVVNDRTGTVVNDRVFVAGDEAAYDGYNLTYTGIIQKITIKGVVIQKSHSTKTRRLDAGDFAFWNRQTLAVINASNEETMRHI